MAIDRPDDAPSEMLGELVRLSTAISEVLARELGVSLRDLSALHHLVGRAPRGSADLAHELGITTASATVMVDRLERAGCLQRRPDPYDRRRVKLEATPDMTARSVRVLQPMTEAIAAVGDALDDEQRAHIAAYLGNVVQVMHQFLSQHQPRSR